MILVFGISEVLSHILVANSCCTEFIILTKYSLLDCFERNKTEMNFWLAYKESFFCNEKKTQTITVGTIAKCNKCHHDLTSLLKHINSQYEVLVENKLTQNEN